MAQQGNTRNQVTAVLSDDMYKLVMDTANSAYDGNEAELVRQALQFFLEHEHRNIIFDMNGRAWLRLDHMVPVNA